MADIPELEPHCNSWIIVKDGKPIMETTVRDTAQKFSNIGYQIFTAAQWLSSLNKKV